ncbi:MAG: response regulator [Candidatus Omnitrophica bacterium]|nr:response regulator [Candidatus Omnitrophota bacterium]
MPDRQKVLIVDDSAISRDIFKAVLAEADANYIIDEASSGAEAFEKVKVNTPDIIILDIQMPGMDGFEVCKKFKADPEYKSIPILIITASDEVEDKIKGFELGAADYINKNINPGEVKARVSAHLKIREIEKDRLEVENLRTVKDMIATFNHYINQPLTTVYAYLTILLLKFDKTDKTGATLTKIKGEIDKINDTLKKVDSLTKIRKTSYIGKSGMIEL